MPDAITLGPCPCKGCGSLVYWGQYRVRSHSVGAKCWRDLTTHRVHFCKAASVAEPKCASACFGRINE